MWIVLKGCVVQPFFYYILKLLNGSVMFLAGVFNPVSEGCTPCLTRINSSMRLDKNILFLTVMQGLHPSETSQQSEAKLGRGRGWLLQHIAFANAEQINAAILLIKLKQLLYLF